MTWPQFCALFLSPLPLVVVGVLWVLAAVAEANG